MVERRRRFLLRLDAVELLDAAVHAVDDRIGEVLDPRAAQRALVLDDPDFRDVNQLAHVRPSCPPDSTRTRRPLRPRRCRTRSLMPEIRPMPSMDEYAKPPAPRRL